MAAIQHTRKYTSGLQYRTMYTKSAVQLHLISCNNGCCCSVCIKIDFVLCAVWQCCSFHNVSIGSISVLDQYFTLHISLSRRFGRCTVLDT